MDNDPVASLVAMPPAGASLFYSSRVTVRSVTIFPGTFLDDPPSNGLAFSLTSFLGL